MDRRRDELAGSEQQVSARPPGRGPGVRTGPDTGEQFAALDVLIGLAQVQERARRQEAAAARLPFSGPTREDGAARTDPLTELLPWIDAGDTGDTGDAGQDYPSGGGAGTKTVRRGRVRALGRRTLTFLSIPGARRSAE